MAWFHTTWPGSGYLVRMPDPRTMVRLKSYSYYELVLAIIVANPTLCIHHVCTSSIPTYILHWLLTGWYNMHKCMCKYINIILCYDVVCKMYAYSDIDLYYNCTYS